jgi:hypothetical protein
MSDHRACTNVLVGIDVGGVRVSHSFSAPSTSTAPQQNASRSIRRPAARSFTQVIYASGRCQ